MNHEKAQALVDNVSGINKEPIEIKKSKNLESVIKAKKLNEEESKWRKSISNICAGAVIFLSLISPYLVSQIPAENLKNYPDLGTKPPFSEVYDLASCFSKAYTNAEEQNRRLKQMKAINNAIINEKDIDIKEVDSNIQLREYHKNGELYSDAIVIVPIASTESKNKNA